MGRKNIEIDERIGNDRVGLMITRGQIEHFGHVALKSQMLVDNQRNIVCFGSSQRSGVFGNPLTSDQKKRAQQGLWGDAFSIVFLQDIGSSDRSTDWGDYVLDRIASHQLPEPTDIYAGSKQEARWYEHHFASLNGRPSYQHGLFDVWENEDTNKRIHILDRNKHHQISSSMVRTLIEQRDEEWKCHVPAKLWDFYDWEYPPELRAAIELSFMHSDWPEAGQYPPGTKGLCHIPDYPNQILMDDGVWRPRPEDMERKSYGD